MPAASACTLELTIHVAWWLRPYLTLCAALDRLGVLLDFDRIAQQVDEGVTCSVAGQRPRHLWSNRLA